MPEIIKNHITEIYDEENDELLIVRESPEIPGLIKLEYDIDPEGSAYVALSPQQAIDVGSTLIFHANMIKERERNAKLKGAEIDRT